MEKNDRPLGFLLSRALFSLTALHRINIKNAGLNLPYSQVLVLRYLHDSDGLSQADLARLMGKDTAAIKRTLDRLESKGLIERRQVTLRKNSIHITDKGIRMMPAVWKITKETVASSLAGISQEEYGAAVDFLNKVYTNSETIIKKAK